jgi:signal transduction histidine kinase
VTGGNRAVKSMRSAQTRAGTALVQEDGDALVARRRLVVLEQQNRLVALAARGVPAAQVLGELARLVEQEIAGAACVVLTLDHVGERLECCAAPSLPSAARIALHGAALFPPKLPHAAAIARGEPTGVADLLADTRWPAWRDLALPIGLRSIWAHPVVGPDGHAIGAIALHFHTPYLPSEADRQMIDSLAPLAGMVMAHDRWAREARSAEERLDSLAANLPGVIYQRMVRPDGSIRYTYISEGTRDLFGLSPQEIVANPEALFERYGREYREGFRERLIKASRELKLWDAETPIEARDGTRKWTHALARPRRMQDGSVVWDGIILDATRLKQANFELAAANRAKSEFLANVSHELRTPLNAIIGFSELMIGEMFGPLGERYAEYIRDIHDSGQHLLTVINDILDLSKIEAGRMEMAEEIFDLRGTIDSILRMAGERAAAGGIAVEVDLPEPSPRLSADERMIKQILINLLSNAIKFTASGGRIAVAAAVQQDGGIAVSVTDTGIGIPADDLPNLCSPFWQIDRGLNRKFEGTGLGLSLCKRMTEMHGGQLVIESEVGVGTTVTVRLPAARLVGGETSRTPAEA